MIPRFKADFGLDEIYAAFSINNTDKNIQEFENRFTQIMQQKHAIAMPYGRTGIIMLLKALNLKDAEVICPAYTCLVVPQAIEMSGNKLVLVDSSKTDFNMSFEHLENAVTSRTRAIIATSLFGHPVDLDQLHDFSNRHPDIIVIQDCAHSFDAQWNGRSVINSGKAAIFGLNISKMISSIFGGMITTNDDALAIQLRNLSAQQIQPAPMAKTIKRRAYLISAIPAFWRPLYSLVNRLERASILNRLTKYHDDNDVFMPADYLQSMTGIEARIGIIQCGKYEHIITHRRSLAKFYFEKFSNSPDFILPPNNPGATYSHFAIRTPFAGELIKYCSENGFQLGDLIEYHIPDHGAYKNAPYFGNNLASNWPGNIINLPVHRSMGKQDALRLASLINSKLDSLRRR